MYNQNMYNYPKRREDHKVDCLELGNVNLCVFDKKSKQVYQISKSDCFEDQCPLVYMHTCIKRLRLPQNK